MLMHTVGVPSPNKSTHGRVAGMHSRGLGNTHSVTAECRHNTIINDAESLQRDNWVTPCHEPYSRSRPCT